MWPCPCWPTTFTTSATSSCAGAGKKNGWPRGEGSTGRQPKKTGAGKIKKQAVGYLCTIAKITKKNLLPRGHWHQKMAEKLAAIFLYPIGSIKSENETWVIFLMGSFLADTNYQPYSQILPSICGTLLMIGFIFYY
jgi:hypothetical protein